MAVPGFRKSAWHSCPTGFADPRAEDTSFFVPAAGSEGPLDGVAGGWVAGGLGWILGALAEVLPRRPFFQGVETLATKWPV